MGIIIEFFLWIYTETLGVLTSLTPFPRRFFIWLSISLPLLGLDLVTKYSIQETALSMGIDISSPYAVGHIQEVFSGFNVVFAKNYGVSFGLFNGIQSPVYQQWILAALALLVIFFLLYQLRKDKSSFALYGVSFICAGALGNVCSRLTDGYVTDFLDFYVGSYHWPAFNVADISITLGAVLYGFTLLHESQNTGKRK